VGSHPPVVPFVPDWAHRPRGDERKGKGKEEGKGAENSSRNTERTSVRNILPKLPGEKGRKEKGKKKKKGKKREKNRHHLTYWLCAEPKKKKRKRRDLALDQVTWIKI